MRILIYGAGLGALAGLAFVLRMFSIRTRMFSIRTRIRNRKH